MRRETVLALIALSTAADGCAPNGLVRGLAAQHVTRATTARIDLVGDEANVGSGVCVEIRDPDLIDLFWTKIRRAYPYKEWSASGSRRIEFYVDPDSARPDATLWLNESDRATLADSARDDPSDSGRDDPSDSAQDDPNDASSDAAPTSVGYRCIGLHAVVESLLRAQWALDHPVAPASRSAR